MVAVSIGISRGASGNRMSDFTIGTTAPSAGDVSVSFNNTDTNGHNILDHEIVQMLEAIVRQILNGGPSSINLLPRAGNAPPQPLV